MDLFPAVILPEDMSDLETRVGLAGALHQAEVGGSVCFNQIVTVVVITEG